ncbi:MAG: F0F1 ATP synthase subunit B [Miltoncostaeaceae bacterium]
MGNLTTYLPLLQAEAEEEGSNPLLSASPGLMIWTLVMFLITLWIMKKYVFGPVGQMVEKRRTHISESIDEAERSRDEATAMLEDYRVRLTEARREADGIREQGRSEGERQKADIVTQAQAQRDRVIADAQDQIDAQARSAAGELRDDVVMLALAAAEKVTRQTLDEAQHRRLIEEAIREADLTGVAAGQGAAR